VIPRISAPCAFDPLLLPSPFDYLEKNTTMDPSELQLPWTTPLSPPIDLVVPNAATETLKLKFNTSDPFNSILIDQHSDQPLFVIKTTWPCTKFFYATGREFATVDFRAPATLKVGGNGYPVKKWIPVKPDGGYDPVFPTPVFPHLTGDRQLTTSCQEVVSWLLG
jgi:hypothetical protein